MDRARKSAANPSSQSAEQIRAQLRANVERLAERSQFTHAQAITTAAIRSYWRSLTSEVAITPPPTGGSLPQGEMEAAATRFGCLLSDLPVADAAFHLSLLYTTLLPSEWRSEFGVYYTPPALAKRLLDQAGGAGLDWATARVIDPAAGAAAFLIPAAERILHALNECTPAIALQNLAARLRGWERDEFSAWMGQVFIEAVALPLLRESKRRLPQIILVGDSLEREISGQGFDLVVGNPPFGRLRLDNRKRARFSRSLFGHANLYGVFMDLAVQLAGSSGLISFLTPSSFLAGEYFKNLRALLWTEAPPVRIEFVSARKGVFEDVLQETVLATYRKGGQKVAISVGHLSASGGSLVVADEAGGFALPVKPTEPWFMPRHADEAQIALSLRSLPDRLEDWGYKVSTGPLVWNRHKNQLRDKPTRKSVPLIWAESITPEGRFEFRSKKRNHKPYFQLSEGDAWLVVDKPFVLLQRTTAKEQARRLIAAEIPASFLRKHGRVTVENHINMLVPIRPNPSVSPRLLAAFLNSKIADRAFRCISGSVAVSAYELESLPLPSAEHLKSLVGKSISQEKVDSVCSDLYSVAQDA